MADITSWLKKNLSSFEPDEFLALNATRQLGKSEQAKLILSRDRKDEDCRRQVVRGHRV